MAFPTFTEDLNIIAALSDEPNLDDGLSAAGLKAKFDEAGNKIKSWLNGALKNAFDELSAGRGLAAGAVTENKLDDGAVTTDKLGDGAVTLAKTAGLQGKIEYLRFSVPASEWGWNSLAEPDAVYHIAWVAMLPGVTLGSNYTYFVKAATNVDTRIGRHDEGFMAANVANWLAADGVRFEVTGRQVNGTTGRTELEIVAFGWGEEGPQDEVSLEILAVPVSMLVPN